MDNKNQARTPPINPLIISSLRSFAPTTAAIINVRTSTRKKGRSTRLNTLAKTLFLQAMKGLNQNKERNLHPSPYAIGNIIQRHPKCMSKQHTQYSISLDEIYEFIMPLVLNCIVVVFIYSRLVSIFVRFFLYCSAPAEQTPPWEMAQP